MNPNGGAGLGRRMSLVNELRLGFVAFEIKVWSCEEKSEMLVAEVKGLDDTGCPTILK